MAMQALSLYESLSDSDAGLITVNEFNAIARLAVTYGYNTWQTTLDESYKGVFTVSYGEVSFDAATRADAQKGYDRLNAGEDARDEATALIYQYSTLLNNERFLKNSKDVLLYEGAEEDGKKVELTVDAMATIVLPEGTVRQIAQVLDKMLTMEDTLSKVPAGWSVDGLSAYAADIDAVYDLLGKVDASAVSDSSVYELVNSWREGGDFFEILYRYYYGCCGRQGSQREGQQADGLPSAHAAQGDQPALCVRAYTPDRYAEHRGKSDGRGGRGAESDRKHHVPVLLPAGGRGAGEDSCHRRCHVHRPVQSAVRFHPHLHDDRGLRLL